MNDTRSCHAPMLEPIDSKIQGIAFADYSNGSSFGHTRSKPIAKAIRGLKMRNEEINFKTLLEEVKKQFIWHRINPEAPH